MTDDNEFRSAGIVTARHGISMAQLQRQAEKLIPGDQKFILILYDGPKIPSWDRQASWASDAPPEDVAKICDAMAKQIK